MKHYGGMNELALTQRTHSLFYHPPARVIYLKMFEYTLLRYYIDQIADKHILLHAVSNIMLLVVPRVFALLREVWKRCPRSSGRRFRWIPNTRIYYVIDNQFGQVKHRTGSNTCKNQHLILFFFAYRNSTISDEYTYMQGCTLWPLSI